MKPTSVTAVRPLMQVIFASLIAVVLATACANTPTQPTTPDAEPMTEAATDEPAPPLTSTATSTPLPEPTATETPAPTPTPAPVVLYEDAFANPDSGWERYRQFDGILDYEEGAYRMRIEADANIFWVNAGQEFAGAQIDVDVQRLTGPDGDLFGIICRLDLTTYDYYLLAITGKGEAGIAKYVGGTLTWLDGGAPKANPAVNPGNAENHLRARCAGDLLTLTVNGQEVLTVQDGDLAQGDVGLAAGTTAGPGTDVLFDNFVISAP